MIGFNRRTDVNDNDDVLGGVDDIYIFEMSKITSVLPHKIQRDSVELGIIYL